MKNKESTSSILDNIRKKMQKIDSANVIEHIELGDEFNYVDKASMQSDTKKIADNIINDSKKIVENAAIVNKVEDSSKQTDAYDIFAKPDAPQIDTKNETPAPQKDDLNLSDLDNLHDEAPAEEKTAEKKNDFDDLNLDDLDDLHDEEETHEETPTAIQEDSTPEDFLATEDHEDDNHNYNDLDLDDTEIDEVELPEEKKVESVEASVTAASDTPTIIDNNQINQANNMISSKVAQEASNSIKQLLDQTSSKKSEIHIDNSPAFKSGETLESLVIATLQPKLDQWLNENLTSIVERIVTSEIKKIVPKE